MTIMIKAIIFDHGGVLTTHTSFREFVKRNAPKYGVDADEFNKVMYTHWNQARINAIPSTAFWEALSQFLKVDKAIIRKDLIAYCAFRPEVFAFVKQLKKQYKLGLLSNQIEDWLEEEIQKHGFHHVFDGIVTSYQSHAVKPDFPVYREMIQKLGVLPKECVFIDDREEYVLAARQLGIKGIRFTDIGQLKTELAMLGVQVNK